MAPVDLQRAFQSMAAPPPKQHPAERRVALDIEEPEAVAVPMGESTVFGCPAMDWLGDDEQDELVKKTVLSLTSVLHFGPRPLPHILDLLECDLDVEPGCAERLFWLAQERGYLSLHEGNVYLGRLRAEV